MKTVTMLSSILTLLLLLSTMTCGLWLKSGGAGSIHFHIICGVLSIIFCVVTLILQVVNWHTKEGRKTKQ